MVGRERLLTLGFPVCPEAALAMGTPLLPVRDTQRASQIAGNCMHFGCVTVVLLLALTCFGPRHNVTGCRRVAFLGQGQQRRAVTMSAPLKSVCCSSALGISQFRVGCSLVQVAAVARKLDRECTLSAAGSGRVSCSHQRGAG